ncbi:MAG: hypothetical protein RI975_926 [Pseudomonadota bacterium]|jgi:hypothetical protein
MSGKWVVIGLLTAVAMFGLSGLQKHKWKVRLALLGVAMGLTPLHNDLVNAVATSGIFGVLFLIFGAAIDLIVGKFFSKELKAKESEMQEIETISESAIQTGSEFDLEKIKKIAKAKSKK